jgi:hypothetical protein
MMNFKEVNGKEIIDDLFSTRDKQLENEKIYEQKTYVSKPKKERKPRIPKKKT